LPEPQGETSVVERELRVEAEPEEEVLVGAVIDKIDGAHSRRLPEACSLDAQAVLRLTEVVFSVVEELSVAAADAFVAFKGSPSSPERIRRTRLHSLLLSDPPVPPETLRDAARVAGWPLPRRIRVAVATGLVGPADGMAPSRVIWGVVNQHCVLVVEDDDESERWLNRAVESLGLERPLVVGPSVSLEQGRQAASHAIVLSKLLSSDPALRTQDIVWCEEHEVDLLLALDRQLSESFSDRLLEPILALPAVQRDRMLDTLAAWLANPGRPRAMADELHLHVQGVRYRLARLRDLLGGALDEPQARFELALALRVRRLD
jgi:PucR-like helix-turn-helix protein